MILLMLMVFTFVYLVLLVWLLTSQGQPRAEHKALLVTLIIIGAWVGSVFGLQTSIGSDLTYARIVFALGMWSVLALTQFVGFMTLNSKAARYLLATIAPFSVVMGVLCIATDAIIAQVSIERAGQVPVPEYGSLAILYIASLAGCIAAILLLVGRGILQGREKSRRQMKVVGVSILIAVSLAVATNFLLPLIAQNSQTALLSPLAILVLIGGLNYSIARQGLFDLKLATIRTVVYILSLCVLAGVYFGLAYVISLVIFGEKSAIQGVDTSPLNVVLALALAFLFQPVKRFFDQLTNRLFYRGEYDQEAFLREFGKLLSYDTDLQLLLKQVSTFIAKNLNAESVFFYMQDKGIYGRTGTRKLQLPGSDVMAITRYREKISSHARVIVTERIESKDMRRLLLGHRIHLTLPLLLQGQVVGYLFVGEHKSRGYTARDMKMLESVANELTIAVQNSLSVEEIRELNESLQHRVDEATRELRESNKQLQRLDEAKDEFISMASHQLRTPLTSIKGYLDMLLEGDFGKTNATQRAVLTEAFMSSERMVGLINDFLNVSRIQTGKFILEKREVDLGAVVEEQARALEVIAKQYELQLEVKISSSVPHVSIDTEKIRQVVMNMLDNAVYYSRPNSVIKVRLTKEKSDVVFKVKDTGIGVPKAEQSQLFGKFFRASNARKRRPDGTGVGLFLSKKVIGVHGGEVLFESTEGKGSVFGFRLPIR